MYKKQATEKIISRQVKALLFLSMALPFTFHPIYAAEFSNKVILTGGVEYDSNPALSEDDRESVWIYSLTPQVMLDARDGINRWYLDAALLMQKHSNERVLTDRDDPRLTIGWDRTYESGMFGIKADYRENTSRILELKSTGEFKDRDGTQKTKLLAGRWQHAFTPRLSALTEAGYTDVEFDDTTSLGSYDVSDIGTKLTYAYTERIDTHLQVGYAHYRPDRLLDDTDLVRLLLGVTYQIREGVNIAASAGVYNLSGEQSHDGWEGGLKLDYAAERMTYLAEANRGLAPAGIGGFQKTDTYRLGWIFDISERDKVGADYGLYRTKQDIDINLKWLDYQQVGAFYERRFGNQWFARVSAAYRTLEQTGFDSHGNLIGLTVTYDGFRF